MKRIPTSDNHNRIMIINEELEGLQDTMDTAMETLKAIRGRVDVLDFKLEEEEKSREPEKDITHYALIAKPRAFKDDIDFLALVSEFVRSSRVKMEIPGFVDPCRYFKITQVDILKNGLDRYCRVGLHTIIALALDKTLEIKNGSNVMMFEPYTKNQKLKLTGHTHFYE